jgi:hypothetical protein
VENNKITPIQPQTIQPQPSIPSVNSALLLEAIARRLAEAQTENHIHYHATSTPSQDTQNVQALLQAVAGLSIIFCLTFGAMSTIILIWRGAQATRIDYQTHTIQ